MTRRGRNTPWPRSACFMMWRAWQTTSIWGITLDKIAEKFGAIEIVTKEEKEELKRLVSEGKSVEAVRRCREITGLGLKEAKEYVDGLGEEKID